MLARFDGVHSLLHNIVDSAQRNNSKILEIERTQQVFTSVVADLQKQVHQLQQAPTASSSQDPGQPAWPSADAHPGGGVIKIDGHDVAVNMLDAPLKVYWWYNGQSYQLWMPRQTAVFDVDRQHYTVDLQSHWYLEPDHHAVPVHYLGLSFRKNDGNQKKRRRHW